MPNVLQWFPFMLRVKPCKTGPVRLQGIWPSQLSCLRISFSLASLFLPFCLLLEHLRGSLLVLSSVPNAFCSPSHGCFLLLFGSLVTYPPQRGHPWPDSKQIPGKTSYSPALFAFLYNVYLSLQWFMCFLLHSLSLPRNVHHCIPSN